MKTVQKLLLFFIPYKKPLPVGTRQRITSDGSFRITSTSDFRIIQG